MKSIRMIAPVLALGLLVACISKSENNETASTIDEQLSIAVDSMLREKMQDVDAFFGEVIVMECATGNIKAWSTVEREDSALVAQEPLERECTSGLWPVAAVLGALDAGRIRLSDIVDTSNGEYFMTNGDTLRDHNWMNGGYGELTVQQGLAYGSRIAIHKATLDTVPSKYQFDTNLQVLSFFNAIATGDSSLVDGNLASLDSLKSALRFCVSDGLGKKAECKNAFVAGYFSMRPQYTDDKFMEFCGYYPCDRSRYTILVTMRKNELPASSGGMCGSLFRQIVEYLGNEGDV